MNYAELPPTNYAKDSGIRGLKQIATQTKQYPYAQRKEIVERYFLKFVARMNKLTYNPDKGIWFYKNEPLTVEEQSSIERGLMEIIAEEF